MDKKNVCKFNVPRDADSRTGSITILNLVHEKNPSSNPINIVQHLFGLYIVTGGRGSVNMSGNTVEISRGDIFATFPSVKYCILNIQDLEYAYVSFLGLDAASLLERAELNKHVFTLQGKSDLIEFWEQSLETANEFNIDLIGQALLFYTVGIMAKQRDEKMPIRGEAFAMWLKTCADDNFTNTNISLSGLAAEKYYDPKYASLVFKKHFGIGFQNYLINLRINNALRLIEIGMTSVKDISSRSGFSDPYYFSRLFKNRFGVAPAAYIKEYNAKKIRRERE